jgi:hypothetical protein
MKISRIFANGLEYEAQLLARNVQADQALFQHFSLDVENGI